MNYRPEQMVRSPSESQQTQAFSIDHANVLPDHYRLVELIGRGGMAEVYLAEDRRLGRKVAIKFLSSEFRRDPDRVRRFRAEARAASALNHPNILIIHDIGDRVGVQFIVSELVEGETLGSRIAQGRVPFAEAVDIAIQVASALSAAHSAGIVHRDIKPDNIMVRRDGVVKVLDFGLAKSRGFTSANGADFDALTLDSGSTSPGLIVGTPQYMSPEQARGKDLDGRTDIFSLGIIIFEMITRHSPFAGATFADTMAAILTKEPRQITEFVEDAPTRLIALIEKCLRKERDERSASMSEVEAELRLLRADELSLLRDTAEVDPAKSDQTEIRPTHQHSIRKFVSSTFQRPSPMAGVIILLAAALLVGGWWAWDRISLRSSAPSLMRTVPITSWSSSASELVTSATFSPDGRMIAFAARRDNSTEVWVKPVVGGDAVQVTKNGGLNLYPVWSSDGQEIAFFSDRGGGMGIWRVPFTGGIQSPILRGLSKVSRPMVWGEDGTIYLHDRPNLYRVAEGSLTEQITSFSESGLRPQTIVLSRNGKHIAYSAEIEGIWKIIITDLLTGNETVVATSPEIIDHFAWHPDGQRFFFSLSVNGVFQIFEGSIADARSIQRSNGDLNYFVQDVSANGSVLYSSVSETSDLWQVSTENATESILANDVSAEFWPDISSTGLIAFQALIRPENPRDAKLIIEDGSENRPIPISMVGSMPTWSNKGDRLAFFHPEGSRLEVWSSSYDGINTQRIADIGAVSGGYTVAPYLRSDTSQLAWSPDDEEIVFSTLEGGFTRLYLTTTDGSDRGRLLVTNHSGGPEREPIWSPDGKQIIFRTQDRASGLPDSKWLHRIRIADVESGQQRELFESEERIRVLGFIDEGKTLLFVRRGDTTSSPTPPTTDVLTLSVGTGAVSKVQSIRDSYFLNIKLSPDGQFLAYVSTSQAKTSIAWLPVGSSRPKELLSINDPKVMISSLEISPDGSFIAFGKQTRTNLLSMLTE